MAKRYQIINVLRKPRKCPNCGEEVWDIIYGTGDMEPWEFLTEYRKSAVMGGDNIPIRPPVWECSCCNTRFRKIKPDGTDAPVKIQLLANIKPAPVMEEGRDERINQMSEAFNRLSAVTATLTDGAEELKDLAPDVDLLKDYISSGQWLKDFEADERGEIGTDVDRSVLSEDGLYNLMEDLDDLMHTFEWLQDKFAADPDLELKLQD